MIENIETDDAPSPPSRAYDVSDIPSAGISGSINLVESERENVATLLQTPEVSKFQFEYALVPDQRKRFRLKGRLTANVVQECIITMEPVEATIDEEIQIDLWPSKDVEIAEKLAEEEGRTILLEGPEPIIDGQIDVGQLAYECLADLLDPFPRKTGAEFESTCSKTAKMDTQPNKPFANLDELLRTRDVRTDKS